jgi:hypothetical protein
LRILRRRDRRRGGSRKDDHDRGDGEGFGHGSPRLRSGRHERQKVYGDGACEAIAGALILAAIAYS